MAANVPPQLLLPKPLRPGNDTVLADGPLLSEPQFFWSASSFVLALGVNLYLFTIHFALQLWWTHTPRWVFMTLAFVALMQLCNLLNMALASLDLEALYDLETQFVITVVDWVFEWSGFCVFATLNWYRFRAMCKDSRPKLVHFFTFLLFLQIATWTSVAVCIGVSYWVPFKSPLVQYAQDYISAAFTLDAVANCIISLAFVYHLRSLHPVPACSRPWTWYLKVWDWWSPSTRSDAAPMAAQQPQQHSDAPHVVTDQEGGPVLYSTMHQLLWRSQVLLFFECALTLSAVIIEEVDWTIDPLWFLMSVAMAVRLRVFCSFFAHLTDMLKSRVRRGPTARRAAPQNAHLHTPGSQTHLGPGGGGGGGRDTSMASLSIRTLLVPGAMAVGSRHTEAGRVVPPD
ncbi:hypothetical protein GGF32_003853 [Allomyces javanicus]|nr:hypothetical protein GGF32_003853 [Allomyces javanicus]